MTSLNIKSKIIILITVMLVRFKGFLRVTTPLQPDFFDDIFGN